MRKRLRRQLSRERGESLCWNALAAGLLEENCADRGEVPSPDIAQALRKALDKNRSPEVVGAVAVALGLLRDQEAQDVLFARMQETGEARVRGYCTLALGMIGARKNIGPIRQVLDASTHQPFALQQAAIALSLLGDQETGERLFDLLENTSAPEVQASIASAMGWIKDPRPLGRLCERLQKDGVNDAARAWTGVAIGRICDTDEWPWVGRASVGVNYDVQLATLIEPVVQTGLLDLP